MANGKRKRNSVSNESNPRHHYSSLDSNRRGVKKVNKWVPRELSDIWEAQINGDNHLVTIGEKKKEKKKINLIFTRVKVKRYVRKKGSIFDRYNVVYREFKGTCKNMYLRQYDTGKKKKKKKK